jgi:hypothetical protein
MAKYIGRGPTRAHATIAGDWVFVVVGETEP